MEIPEFFVKRGNVPRESTAVAFRQISFSESSKLYTELGNIKRRIPTCISYFCSIPSGVTVVHGGVAGRDTARVRFPMASLEYFIDIILPDVLWPWGSTRHLTKMNIRNFSCGGKGDGCVRLTTLPLHVPIVVKFGSLNLLEPSGPVQGCNGIAIPSYVNLKDFVFFLFVVFSQGTEDSTALSEVRIGQYSTE